MVNNSEMKRITITLTPEQLDLLSLLKESNGYETMSRTVRVLVNKYAKKEIKNKS